MKLSQTFRILGLGVTVLFLFIYILLVVFLSKRRFCCFTFDKELSLTSITLSMKNYFLNFLFKCQISFTYIKVFNYDSFNLNQILLIRSLILIFQDIIHCVLIIHQIPKEEVCVCFIKATYLLLDVIICVLYQNELLLRLNWWKFYIFYLQL